MVEALLSFPPKFLTVIKTPAGKYILVVKQVDAKSIEQTIEIKLNERMREIIANVTFKF